jgi:carboxynorspermidine decarboxylase
MGEQMKMDFHALPTPCYVVDRELLKRNLTLLRSVMDRTGCRILLAQKAFSMFSLYPMVGQYLSGTTASSLFEAKLGREEMGGETHIFAPAYREDDFGEIVKICDHIVFNSFDQKERFWEQVKSAPHHISCGIRVNPEYSEIETDIYNPCFANSRLGVTEANFREDLLDGIEGLHFHTMCEQNSDTLERTADVFCKKFGKYLKRMKWVNLGGGHHITRPDYDVETLVRVICRIRDEFGVTVYLEPGEAVALNTGYLVSRVLDIVHNGMDIAILDTSAACHMPDVLEMPYRPEIIGAGKPGEQAHTYRLGGPTCLAGDIIGDYSFPQPLKAGDELVFCDMAHYTMVKNNTFNGENLPSIACTDEEGNIEVVKCFGYEDFKGRLS